MAEEKVAIYQCPCGFLGQRSAIVEHWDSEKDRRHRLLAQELSQNVTDAAIVAEVEAEEEFIESKCKKADL